MENIVLTHLTIPEIKQLFRQELQSFFSDFSLPTTESNADQWFSIDQLCAYLPDKPSKQTVYGWVHTGIIPCHKGAKKLRFLKSEIDSWLLTGRKKTVAEITAEAGTFVNRKKR